MVFTAKGILQVMLGIDLTLMAKILGSFKFWKSLNGLFALPDSMGYTFSFETIEGRRVKANV